MQSDYQTLVTPEARGGLGRVPRAAALHILRKLLELQTDPYGFFSAGPVPLELRPGRRLLSVGEHRVAYTVEHQRIIIWTVRATRPTESTAADRDG